MALNIKDPATDRLARRLAELTGTSLTVAIRDALQMRVDWVTGSPEVTYRPRSAEMQELLADIRAHRSDGLERSEDEILGWDENGLPT